MPGPRLGEGAETGALILRTRGRTWTPPPGPTSRLRATGLRRRIEDAAAFIGVNSRNSPVYAEVRGITATAGGAAAGRKDVLAFQRFLIDNDRQWEAVGVSGGKWRTFP